MPGGVYPRTPEHNANISKALRALGDKHWTKRPEVKEKFRIRMTGKVGYWAGKKRDDPAYIEKISRAHKGQRSSPDTEFKKGVASKRKGNPFPQIAGENHYCWKGGVSSANSKIRRSLLGRQWRESVFNRDNWTCQHCKKSGGDLHAHHIKPFSKFPEHRFDIENGVTLCVDCHRTTHR